MGRVGGGAETERELERLRTLMKEEVVVVAQRREAPSF